jgi:predicted ATPase/class 3 adenylate cyclase
MIGVMEDRSAGTITFLFTDVEGSTRLWEQFPDGMKGALERHDTILRAAIDASGGRIVKTTGDGMMAVFERAADAATAGLTAQRALATEPWSSVALRVRMGLHAGQAEQRGGDFFGPTVNRTARTMAAGHGGQVLLSDSAAALASDHLPEGASLRDLGEHRLRDLGRAEHVFQLLHPDLESSFPPLAALPRDGGNLPQRSAPFVGRQDELDEILTRLEDPAVRLLTLTGPGGTGKTTLAVRAAEHVGPGFRDGVAFVDLSSARQIDAVAIAVARAVGVGDVGDRSLQDELVNVLRSRRMLLVLDNFEQVTEAADMVGLWLRDCAELKLLVTSREALHVRAEHVYRVPPLGLPPASLKKPSALRLEQFEAIQLFVDRARAVQSDFRLTDDNAAAVAEICRRLDGLPLAIELAAARLRLFSPEALRDRLGDRLGLLRSGPRDLPERQQALRATIDWSYDLLDASERRLFELLSVFHDASVAAVETVALEAIGTDGDASDLLDRLTGLIEKSLVRQIEAANGEPRVGMLETIRAYAAERLDQCDDGGASARRAHALFYAELASAGRRELLGNHRETALTNMANEVENLRIAWRHWVAESDLEQLDKLASSLLILYDARGWYIDTVALTTDLLTVLASTTSSPERISKEIALRTTLARALIATKGYTPEAEDALASAVDLFERGADARQQFTVLRGLVSLYDYRAEFDKVISLGAEILELAERENNPRMLIDGHLVAGMTKMFLSDLQAGLDHFDTAIALFPKLPVRSSYAGVGNDSRVACLTTSAITLWMMGYPDRAAERATDALALAAELDHPFTSAFARFHSGLIHLWRREPDIALDRAISLLEIADDHDFRIWTAAGTCLLGAAQVGLDRFDEGLGNIRTGLDLYQGMRSPPVFWPMLLFVSAAASLRAGRPADAMGPIDRAIEFMSVGGDATLLPEFHVLKGDILAALEPGQHAGPSVAEPWYRRAFDRAAELDARTAWLRAATRLARVRLAEGQPDLASSTLGPVLASFTEGFATLDLREAQALLDEIAEDRSATPGRRTSSQA